MKILNLKTTKKLGGINITAFVLLGLFLFSFFTCFICLNIKTKKLTLNYNSSLKNINTLQEQYNSKISNQPKIVNNEEHLFSNGTDALITSVKNLNLLDYFCAEFYGNTIASCGINLNIDFYIKLTKNNNIYEQTCYFYSSSLSSVNSVLYGSYDGSNYVVEKYSRNITKNADGFSSDIDCCSPYKIPLATYKKTKGNVPGNLFFDFNAKSILSTRGFYYSQHQRSSNFYYTNFSLNPNLSTNKYMLFIKHMLGGGTNYNFTNITGNATINENGTPNNINIIDSYSLNYPVGPIAVKIIANSNIQIVFSY